MKKKILITAVNLDIGGIEKSLINLLNNIDYEKYDVTLILEEKKGMFLDCINKNVIVKELKVSKNKIVFFRKIINFTRQFISKLKYKNKFDFSCCYATYSYSGAKLTLMASKNSCLYVHNDYSYIYDEKGLRHFFDSRNIHDFNTIVFVANESKNHFLEYYPELKNKATVLNNFIDVKDIIQKSQEKVDLKLVKNRKHLVFVGRLEDHSKKVGRAINLVKNIPDIDLIVVGDGPDRKMYEDMIEKNNLSDRVILVGKKNNPYPYIKMADYFILTSNYEGFPVTYLESIVLNTPIITTINTSDDQINIKDGFGDIISKDENKMIDEVKEILKGKQKLKNVDFDAIQNKRKEELESIIEKVI